MEVLENFKNLFFDVWNKGISGVNISEIAVASGVILGSTAIKEYNENFIKAKSLLDIFKS